MSRTLRLSGNGKTITLNLEPGSLTDRILETLPFETRISTWGDEIYFPVPVDAEPGELTEELEVGDVVFWHEGQSLCVFFGPTPKSEGDEPVPADEVEVIGTVENGLETLSELEAGDDLSVDAAD